MTDDIPMHTIFQMSSEFQYETFGKRVFVFLNVVTRASIVVTPMLTRAGGEVISSQNEVHEAMTMMLVGR